MNTRILVAAIGAVIVMVAVSFWYVHKQRVDFERNCTAHYGRVVPSDEGPMCLSY